MDLYMEMVVKAIRDEFERTRVPSVEEMFFELRCYAALKKIKAVLSNDKLDDVKCFQKIEEIVRIFEEAGSDGGGRHEF